MTEAPGPPIDNEMAAYLDGARQLVYALRGLGRLRKLRIRCKGRSTVGPPVIFCTNEFPRPNESRQRFTTWSAWETWGTITCKGGPVATLPGSSICQIT
jgi:hypothetical protein